MESTKESTNLVTIADRFIAAFNVGDWEQFAAPLHPDVHYSETGTNREVVGAEPYVQLCQGWRHVFPDCTGTIRAVTGAGETVVQEILWDGTQAAPLPTPSGDIPATGRRIAVAATIWYRFEGTRMVAIRHHLDVFTMFQQLGAFEK